MKTTLKKFVPTEEGITVTLKFPSDAMQEIISLYDQEVTIAKIQTEIPTDVENIKSEIIDLCSKIRDEAHKL